MKQLVFLIPVLVFFACKTEPQKVDDRDSMLKTISSLEMAAMQSSQAIDPQYADSLMMMFDKFVQAFPKDSLCAEFMNKAADVASNINDCNKALGYLNKVIDGYSSSGYVEWAYFRKGAVYSDVCSNKEKAIESYQFFIDNYPTSKRAKDATVLLNLLKFNNELDYIHQLEAKQNSEGSESNSVSL
jgi:outer membrane protein assembly factor BamD (BamD/ComL family)